jgi:dipeptide/tripeptide permease
MNIFDRLLGINWRTTLAGVGVIVAAVGRLVLAYRTKDIEAMVTDSQLVFETIGMLIVGFGLAQAKDQNVTGTGTSAKTVDSAGVVTNREGVVVGQQPPPHGGSV